MVTAVVTLALDVNTCVRILRECGFVPTSGIGLVNLFEIPDGLKADEIETYLRMNGADLCSAPAAGNQAEPPGNWSR